MTVGTGDGFLLVHEARSGFRSPRSRGVFSHSAAFDFVHAASGNCPGRRPYRRRLKSQPALTSHAVECHVLRCLPAISVLPRRQDVSFVNV